MKSLRIGFDVSGLFSRKPLTGLERYQLSLIYAMLPLLEAAHITLYLYSVTGSTDAGFVRHPKLREIAHHTRVHWRTAPFRHGWYKLGLGLAMRFDRLDMFHFTTPLMPRYCPVPAVVTFHDLASLSLPEAETIKERMYLDDMLEAGRRATALIAVSQSTNDALVRYLHRTDAHVVLEGVDLQQFKRREDKQDTNSPEHYILCVGTLHTRKNHIRLMQAFEQIAPKIPHKLLIVGKDGSSTAQMQRYLSEHPTERIVQLGYVDDQRLVELYSGAAVLIMPSLWEGFGLPLIEAMACGTPVITSNISGLCEIAGDAAVLVDPSSVDDIAKQLYRVLTDEPLRMRLIEAGYRRSAALSWEAAAAQTIAVYETVRR
jgi:glycosyltransferase involved in cell wall biosynthesis